MLVFQFKKIFTTRLTNYERSYYYLETHSICAKSFNMNKLKVVIRILCLVPLLTGLADLILGAGALSSVGVDLSRTVLENATLNSQLRFFAAIWFGFGVMLWIVAGDLVQQATWFKLMCWILILSGVGRLASIIQFGLPAPPFIGATFLELAGIPLLLIWHSQLLRKHHNLS
jgi:hypothetical protein